MAKNRNKKKKNGASAMDSSGSTQNKEDIPQAMDTTETTASKAPGVLNRKIKKGVTIRRSKNLRKMKAVEKAISRGEKEEERIMKNENKTSKTQSAKTLYD
ncbi:hypothetical protein MKX01_003661 [Papaver californicum]|nr:hypothetical protein MKX01_003661 [Papaver californicum]